MTTYTIEFDLSELKKLSDSFAKGMTTASLPNTDAAFQRAALTVKQMWTNYLQGSQTLPGVETPSNVTSAMVKSIRTQDKTTDFEFHQRVYSDNRRLEQLNQGSKAVEYDMKKTHPYGKQSRVSKKGIPYLIIPFRWRTPGQSKDTLAHGQFFSSIIPTKFYNTSVKGLNISSANSLKNYWEKNFRGESIERQGYDWAKFGRLTDEQAWDDRSRGMVRMMDDRKPGRITSTYFTFRIISAKSPASSWIYKKAAKPGLNYMAALESAAKPQIEKIINEGIKADEEFYRNQH